jgi:hypothetical protein
VIDRPAQRQGKTGLGIALVRHRSPFMSHELSARALPQTRTPASRFPAVACGTSPRSPPLVMRARRAGR